MALQIRFVVQLLLLLKEAPSTLTCCRLLLLTGTLWLMMTMMTAKPYKQIVPIYHSPQYHNIYKTQQNGQPAASKQVRMIAIFASVAAAVCLPSRFAHSSSSIARLLARLFVYKSKKKDK